MRQLVMAVVGLMVMAVVAVPSAVAQDAEKEKEYAADKAKKMEQMKEQSHWMKGTMTPPDQEAMEIAYVFAKEESGAKGWIVVEEDGEKTKVEMRDLSMDGEYVNYNWSPPDDASTVITCSLMKQSDGGFAGDCTDNQEEGRTGQMTMAPMDSMNPCAPEKPKKMDKEMKEMKEMNPCGG